MTFHVATRAMSTLSTLLSAISHFHSKFHFPSPTTYRAITRALQGAKCSYWRPSVSAKIFTPDNLSSLASIAYKPNCNFVFLRTIWRIFIELFGLLHFNGVSNLQFEDIKWTTIGFDLKIRKSKTDQHGKGDFVSISQNTNPMLCPVSLSLWYFKRLNYSSGFLLPTLKGHWPLSDKILSYTTALKDLRKVLSLIDIDPAGFGEHSGRRGGATFAASAGAPIDELMLQGRWRSSEMPRLYTDNASKLRREFAIRLSKM